MMDVPIHCQLICYLYFDPSPIGTYSVEVEFSFLLFKYLKDLSSDGTHTAISDSIEKKN